MNIDRHNYEEFFLLYIDNELTIAEKKQVEVFVAENPDLEEEFLMLKQSKLVPDEKIVFAQKEILMKQSAAITINNYVEFLLLHIDDELDGEARLELEKFIAVHPFAKQQLELLKQTKLQPERIVFPGKQSLYRKEKETPLIVMNWWKAAIAAVLLISAGITVYNVTSTNKPGAGTPFAKKQAPVKNKAVNDNSGKESILTKPAEDVTNGTELVQQEKLTNKNLNKENEPLIQDKLADNNNKAKDTERNKTQNDLPVLTNKRLVAINNIPERPLVQNQLIENANQQGSDAFRDNEKPSLKKSFTNGNVTSTDFASLNQSNNTGDVFASQDKNKTLRGFFRKATRFIERTTNINPANDDEKVLIGGVAINLK